MDCRPGFRGCRLVLELARWFAVGVAVVGCGRVNFELEQRHDAALDAIFDAVSDASIPCLTTYQILGTSCYRFVSDMPSAGDWLAAEAACEADGAGAHLAVIDDADEFVLLIANLRLNGTSDAAIGFSDRTMEGVYRAVTGGPAFLSWAPGNPDGGNDCGSLRALIGDSGTSDATCTSNFNDYICEFDRIPVDVTAF